MCCVAEGRNIVTKNIIGTDPSGAIPLGNHTAGVIIDRSNHNIVGPGNIIAYNDGSGVMFWKETFGNTVTENLIHDNGEQGISTEAFGDLQPLPPIIFNFDLQTGILTGAACANCIVEIFSDKGDEGAIYEGRAETEENGTFTFEKGAPLGGPSLTATVTDPAGTTSQFSHSTQGTRRSLSLQGGEDFGMITGLQNRPSSELADNRIGGVAETKDIGDWVWNTGLKWIRVIVDSYGQWQHVDWERDEYTIDPDEEKVIDDLVNHDVRIMLVLDVWHPEYKIVYYKTEENIATYLTWVRFMVRHFKGRIEYYEILNEPDLNFEAPSGMPVDAYVNLVNRTVPVIRQEDPNAKIVVGAIPDTRFDGSRDWMWGLPPFRGYAAC